MFVLSFLGSMSGKHFPCMLYIASLLECDERFQVYNAFGGSNIHSPLLCLEMPDGQKWGDAGMGYIISPWRRGVGLGLGGQGRELAGRNSAPEK